MSDKQPLNMLAVILADKLDHTQARLSKAIEVNSSSIYRWVHNEQKIPEKNIKGILDALSITRDELFGGYIPDQMSLPHTRETE